MEPIEGRVWVFGNDVDTDLIIPARHLNTSDPAELAKHCMEDADPEFAAKVSPGDVIVAGKNFGCGSSREHAPISIKAAGVSCVIARDFARIFYRNAFNTGLPILECTKLAGLENSVRVRVDFDKGEITRLDTGDVYATTPIPPFMQELLAAGGLMPHIKRRIEAGEAGCLAD
ncbi:MAG: 3-isopropylmalate dehydratase small subunit [Desulfatibacillaceae bacterium]